MTNRSIEMNIWESSKAVFLKLEFVDCKSSFLSVAPGFSVGFK